ncbi:hypothetical protein ASL11_26415 [Paenibacillus sp. Soil750]|nr:hypothetical protein ASL11_26415 [Paenibacillus sp. Soil750]
MLLVFILANRRGITLTEQSYVNEMTDVLQAIGITESEIRTCLAYINGNLLEVELLGNVSPIDFK